MVVFGQDPSVAPGPAGDAGVAGSFVDSGFWTQLQEIGWVDRTAMAVLLVFFVIGLFKGLIWQVSRVGILVAAYVVSGRYGHVLGDWLAQDPAGSLNGTGGAEPVPATHGVDGAVQASDAVLHSPQPAETTLYLAYVLLFLAVLVVLSLLAILLQKLAKKAGLGFFDRVGGGVLGVATGACLVLFGLSVVHMFFRGSQLAMAAEHSHSLRLSQQAIAMLGESVPDELRKVFALQPLDSGLTDDDGATGNGQTSGAPGSSLPGSSVPGGSVPGGTHR